MARLVVGSVSSLPVVRVGACGWIKEVSKLEDQDLVSEGEPIFNPFSPVVVSVYEDQNSSSTTPETVGDESRWV